METVRDDLNTQMTRSERNATRLEQVCTMIRENGGKITAQIYEERLAELRTLCTLIPGTPVFQEYILGLLDAKELNLDGALAFFFVDASKGKRGVYARPVAQEFERMMILFELPCKISEAGKRNDKQSGRYLKELAQRWKNSCQEKNQQPVDTGVSQEALKKILEGINESRGDENMGPQSI